MHLLLLALATLATAQSSTPAATAPLISATAVPNTPQRIAVGSPSGGLVFQPNVVTAPPGSLLEFHFYPKNHSVVSGPYDTPCESTPDAIYSGFIPSSVGESNRIFTVRVNDTTPLWLYCSQEEHCQNGMAMVVNPPDAASGQTLDGYFKGAAQAKSAQSLGMVQGGVVGTVNGTGTGAASSPMATPSPTMGAGGAGSSGGSGSKSGSVGAAAAVGEPSGLVAGAVLALVGWIL